MIYDDIAINFINIVQNLKRDANVIIEMKMTAYVYDEYGDKDSSINDNIIINLPKFEIIDSPSLYRKAGKKECQEKK